MARWVIGDVHGCRHTFSGLLRRVGFRPGRDRLWLTGDLERRGGGGLPVLRWAHDHRDVVTTVLGNHDIKLLAAGVAALRGCEDDADLDGILGWLAAQPYVAVLEDAVVVHAGFRPEWDLEEAVRLARTCSGRMRTPGGAADLYAGRGTPWREDLGGAGALAAASAVFTRIRTLDAGGDADFDYTGPPEDAPPGSRPWYELSPIPRPERTVIFGHWARLGYRRMRHCVCLDSGCRWGGALTALCLDDGSVVQVPLAEGDRDVAEVPLR